MITEYLGKYFTELVVLTNAMAPYLLLGFLFAGILHVFFKKERVARLLGSNKIRSTVYASIIGVPLPLCSCGVIPTGISFYKNGASKGSTVSFLISTPQTGVDSIMATYSMLGLPFAILRPFIAFISGIVGGAFTNYLERNEEPVKQLDFQTETEEKISNPFWRMLHYAFVEFMQDIAKWLIIGLLLAALISLLLPPDFFSEYISNDILSMLIILVASVPLYVCATGSIPIAAVLLMKGISPGAALVFLMAGPATNAATITVLGKVMGKKALVSYLISIIGASLFFGFVIDHFLPREWFMSVLVHGSHDHQHGLPAWFEITSSIVLTALLLNIYIKKFIKRIKLKSGKKIDIASLQLNSSNGEHLIKISGMDCSHCKTNVEQGIAALEGIELVSADIDSSTVKIRAKRFNPQLIQETVESLGYNYQGEIKKKQYKRMENYKIYVKGMTCNHCKMNVEKTLKSIDGVSNAVVDLDQAMALIEGTDLDMNEIKNQIDGIGYEYGGIVP